MTYLRWASQEPTKVATVAQIAAPQGTASYSCDPNMTYLRWAPQEPTKVATVAQIAARCTDRRTQEKVGGRRQEGGGRRGKGGPGEREKRDFCVIC